MVAKEVRNQMVTKMTIRQYLSSVLQTVQSVIPLIVLGCARLVATWGVEYQEHVSEYGVHWNFFFTLAIVKVTCLYACLMSLSNARTCVHSLVMCCNYSSVLQVVML